MKSSNAPSANRFLLFIGLVLSLAFMIPAVASADTRADAETLTHSLVGLNNAYQKAPPHAKSAALQELIDATVERQARLAELIKTDPGAVLRVAMPERVRQQMPAEVQPFIEQRLELEGELEVMYEDYADGSYRLLHAINANGERTALHFKSPPDGLLSGTPAQVSGVLVNDAMAVYSGQDDILVLALDGGEDGGTNGGSPEPVPNTLGEQRTLVILVNFQDDPVEPYSPEFANDVIIQETSDFFYENSFGQTWLSGDVAGWYTIPLDSTVCDVLLTEDYGEQAARNDGFDLAAYSRLVFAFPQNACSFWGTATVGGNPSRAALNGDLELALTGHELGHNLGLSHAHSLVCNDGSSVGPGSGSTGGEPWPNCERLEYGDGLDIMGWSPSGHFSAYQKERLGWLGYGSSPAIERVDMDGSFELSPYAAPDDGKPKGLKILKAEKDNGYRTWYYLEYRQAVGFDSYIDGNLNSMDESNVLNGITFHAHYEGSGGNGLYLLDMTPETNIELYQEDPALVAGRTFVDPDGVATITTDWTDAGGALVSVALDKPVCSRANPALSLSPSESQWVEAGTPVTYTATLSNLDSVACSAAAFDLAAGIPGGWEADLAAPTLTLEPGTTETATLTVTSSSSATDDFYDVQITATNGYDPSYATTKTVNYVVSNPPVNQPPVALDDSAETQEGIAIVVDVLANDFDPDGDPLSLTNVTQGINGYVTINPDATVSYLPNVGFSGTDEFRYSVFDGSGDSASATVTVTVFANPPNQPPLAVNDTVIIREEAPVTIDVSANDSDPEGAALSIVSVTQGEKGMVTINADGTLTYSPEKRFKDRDSFSYTISDGSASATASVTVLLESDSGGGGKGRKPKG